MGFYQFKREDAERFAFEQGIKARHRNDELQLYECPYCREKTDQKNSFAINLKTGQFKCLRASCGAHGNMITLARDFKFSLGRDVDEYYNQQRQYRNFRNYPRPETREPAVAYMEGRGISAETTKKYAITTRKDNDNVLVFPFYDETGELQFVKYRRTDFDKTKHQNKEWCEANCKPILFGMDRCNPENKTLVLTEGQIDSLSVAEAGIENAVSVPTGAKGFTWVPYCWDFMSQFDTLIVFGDHEKGKITLLEEMATRFQGTIKHVSPEDYKDCKDANDILRKYGKDAVRAAVQNAVPVEDRHIKPLEEVQRVNLADLERFSSGIPTLDRKLGGLYMGQLVVLTGERGEGKSTFASQLATRAVQAGYSVFFYSGELMDWYFRAWFDCQVAGPGYINAKGNGDDKEYLIRGECYPYLEKWYSGRFYLYDNDILKNAEEDYEGDTLLKTAEKTIKQYGCRVLFFDNLMTAVDDDDPSADVYRQQTRFVKDLAIIAKRFNVLMVLIAHPRKQTGKDFSNDDVAGSSNITNLADVVLRYMQPKISKEEPNPPKGRIQIWKNRLTGKTEKKIDLDYDERSRRIMEKYSPDGFTWRLGWEDAFEGDGDDSNYEWAAGGFVQVDEDGNLPFL